jgi:hypothetical protein
VNCQTNAEISLKITIIIIFKILHSCGFVVALSNSMTSACLLGMSFFSTCAAVMAKRDCASQFILADKLEKKTIAKSKQKNQHHSTHSGCSKT